MPNFNPPFWPILSFASPQSFTFPISRQILDGIITMGSLHAVGFSALQETRNQLAKSREVH